MIKVPTSCCALCQLRGGNSDSLKDILQTVETLKEEALIKRTRGLNNGGERAAFTIVSPGEEAYEANLVLAGFKEVNTFDRRYGYPEGILKMYMLNW